MRFPLDTCTSFEKSAGVLFSLRTAKIVCPSLKLLCNIPHFIFSWAVAITHKKHTI